ncbi:MAG TPA: sigma-70 family RNA polymerase sigma factor [Thermoanaerobaculia bacterium]|jgi:RNA polymerase sigma-70 factor (ECF subfamily)|nr:sigma-70 family RNA polymerase sigma factor [Thermoanaerobaculia bacterium]
MTQTSYDIVETLVANHRQFLAFLEKRVESREAAEDILQEAFVRGLSSASLREAESATAWLYRALRNAVVDHYRRRGAEARGLELVAAESEEEVQPDLEIMNAVCACINTLIPTLKPEYASAIQRVELDEVAVRDYATEQEMTPNAAGVRLFRAREALRRRLVQSCGTCADHGCLDCRCGRRNEATAIDSAT